MAGLWGDVPSASGAPGGPVGSRAFGPVATTPQGWRSSASSPVVQLPLSLTRRGRQDRQPNTRPNAPRRSRPPSRAGCMTGSLLFGVLDLSSTHIASAVNTQTRRLTPNSSRQPTSGRGRRGMQRLLQPNRRPSSQPDSLPSLALLKLCLSEVGGGGGRRGRQNPGRTPEGDSRLSLSRLAQPGHGGRPAPSHTAPVLRRAGLQLHEGA